MNTSPEVSEQRELDTVSSLDWFLVTGPVGRRTYITAGFSLAALKYSIELFAVWFAT